MPPPMRAARFPAVFLAGDSGDASISSGMGSASMFAAGVLSGCGMVAVGASCGVVSGVSCSKGFCASIQPLLYYTVQRTLRYHAVYYGKGQNRLQFHYRRRFLYTSPHYVRTRLGIRMVRRISSSVS